MIGGFIVFLIVFTPMAFGTVETWSITIMECIAFLAVATWLVRMTHEKEITFARLLFHIPLAVILCIVILQLLPLPPKILGLLSPETFSIYKEAIPDWPQSHPFNTIETTASELGIYIFSHETLSPKKTLSIYPFTTQGELLKFLTYLSVFYLVINNFKDQKTLERLNMLIIFMGLLLAVFALIQYFTWNGKIYWLREIRHGGPSFGPFVNRNHFAGYIEMVIPLTLGNLVARTLHADLPGKGLGLKERVLASFNRETSIIILLYSAATIMMLSLFFSLSRGGILSLLTSIIIFTTLVPKRKRLTPIFAILGVIFLLGVGQEMVVSRFLQTEPEGRYDYWKDSVGAIKDFPVFGTGLGTFPWIYRKYQSTDPDTFVDYAHNDYVQLLVEMGALGLLTVLGFCTMYFIYVITLLKRRKSAYTKALVCGGIASLGSILTHSIVDFNLHICSNALLATLIAALTLGLVCAYEREGESKTLLRFWKLPLKKRWSVITGYGLMTVFLILLLSIPIRNGLAWANYKLKEQYQNPYTQLALLQRASQLQPLNSDYYRALSNSYSLMGERATALPFLFKAIYLRPTDPFLHLQLATLLDSFSSLREVPPNYAPWETAISHHLRTSMAFFHINPAIHAESAKLLLKKWDYLDERHRQETLSTIQRVLMLDSGKYSEIVLEALWEASRDISLIKKVIPESGRQYESVVTLVERFKNSDKNTKENRLNK